MTLPGQSGVICPTPGRQGGARGADGTGELVPSLKKKITTLLPNKEELMVMDKTTKGHYNFTK